LCIPQPDAKQNDKLGAVTAWLKTR